MNTSLSRIMRSAALVFLLGCVPALYAQEKPRKDHSTRPDVYYLNEGDVASTCSLLLLRVVRFCFCMTRNVMTGANCSEILRAETRRPLMPM